MKLGLVVLSLEALAAALPAASAEHGRKKFRKIIGIKGAAKTLSATAKVVLPLLLAGLFKLFGMFPVFPVYKKEGEAGDLYVTYRVKIPTALSEKEKELFTQLAQLKK